MEFKKINAKICPEESCKQIIPEEWTSAYNDEWCPKCGCGMSEEDLKKIRANNSK